MNEFQTEEILDDFSLNPKVETKEDIYSEQMTTDMTDTKNPTVIENLVNMVKLKGRSQKTIPLNRPYQKSIMFDEDTHRRMSMIKAFYFINQQDLALYDI